MIRKQPFYFLLFTKKVKQNILKKKIHSLTSLQDDPNSILKLVLGRDLGHTLG